MNESNQLIGNKPKPKIKKRKLNLKVNINKNFIKHNNLVNKCTTLFITISLVVILLCLLILKAYKKNNNFKFKKELKKQESSLNKSLQSKVKKKIPIKFNIEKYKKEIDNKESDSHCNNLDPINIFDGRLKDKPIEICKSRTSKHICYKNSNSIFVAQNGVICKMENITLDPSKWKDGGYIYKGPVDPETRGCPILKKGFFNMKCESSLNEVKEYDSIYNSYFEGWNYEYSQNENEEELAPGKTIFFVSRNQDSPNLYHGGSEFVNVVSMMYLLNLNPEDIQVVFLESITLNDDPFYDLYKNLISRGGEPIYIKNLKKKYHISSALHVPINWDSPCFIYSGIPDCKSPTKTYKFYNDLIDKYMDVQNYEDSFKSDGEIFYYPKSIIKSHNSKMNFTKIVTFQWRRVWPRGRKGQERILGNGPELAEKLASLLPKNILLRLVDTASLPIAEQIAILRKTDYYVGIHGAGLCLSIYAPSNCIFHEVLPRSNMNGLLLMAALSGHKTYSDIILAEVENVNGNELVYFNEELFAQNVISHMKENKLID